jgi:hypothetical protein
LLVLRRSGEMLLQMSEYFCVQLLLRWRFTEPRYTCYNLDSILVSSSVHTTLQQTPLPFRIILSLGLGRPFIVCQEIDKVPQ